jgi:hypothetical protein
VDDIVTGLDHGGVAVVKVNGGIFNLKNFTDADKDPASGGGHEIASVRLDLIARQGSPSLRSRL